MPTPRLLIPMRPILSGPLANPPRPNRLCAAVALALGGVLAVPGVQAAAVLPLSALDGSTGFRLDGVAAGDYSGVAVSAAGDLNGDGIDDLLIGAYGADPNGNSSAGSSYVVFGKPLDIFRDGFEDGGQ